jgi:ElaB/YqjD/DUF883 family membrane-anchored ribosome-binding protein
MNPSERFAQDNGQRPSEQRTQQLRAEIAETRERLANDLGAIGEKFTPEHVAGTAKEMARHTAERVSHRVQRAGSGAVDYARENPIPLALIGIGVGWLIASSIRSRRLEHTMATPYYPTYHEDDSYRYAQGTSGELVLEHEQYRATPPSEERSKVSQAASRVKERVGHTGERIGHTGQRVWRRAKNAGHRTREQVQHGVHQAGDNLSRMMDEKPLALAAVAFAAGAGVGLLLPAMRHEPRIIGDARQRLMDQAQDKLQHVKDVAQRAATQAKESVQEVIREESRREGQGEYQTAEPGFYQTPSASTEYGMGSSEAGSIGVSETVAVEGTNEDQTGGGTRSG